MCVTSLPAGFLVPPEKSEMNLHVPRCAEHASAAHVCDWTRKIPGSEIGTFEFGGRGLKKTKKKTGGQHESHSQAAAVCLVLPLSGCGWEQVLHRSQHVLPGEEIDSNCNSAV